MATCFVIFKASGWDDFGEDDRGEEALAVALTSESALAQIQKLSKECAVSLREEGYDPYVQVTPSDDSDDGELLMHSVVTEAGDTDFFAREIPLVS